ncbi:MAG: flagellar basal body P-ring formation chaperone FlgA [Synergistaceae bacterium]|jgi:flagella basal body P-ring formation protein FlgA|nr:flagellar basal body P-ring formation chaperone FlgA [Synergistaceae bacterium]
MKKQIERRRGLRRFFVFCAAAFAALLFASPGGAAEALRISIPSVVRMEGEACALSDIAALEGRRDLTDRVGALLLSAQNGVITREQVIDALKVSGLEDVRVELAMPATVKVQLELANQEGLLSEGDSRRGDLAEWIKSLSSWEGEVEARYQGSIPDGRLVSPASIVPGTSAATLRFEDETGKKSSLPVRLAWSQPVLVLTRSVKRGEVLKESDFALRQIRVNRAGVYASKPAEALGRSLRKNFSQGEAIPLNSLAEVPIIERGKNVTILARNAGIMVKTKGEALESGGLGDSIKVRNLASKAVLTAVVVANDTVEVKMP